MVASTKHSRSTTDARAIRLLLRAIPLAAARRPRYPRHMTQSRGLALVSSVLFVSMLPLAALPDPPPQGSAAEAPPASAPPLAPADSPPAAAPVEPSPPVPTPEKEAPAADKPSEATLKMFLPRLHIEADRPG